MSQEKEAIAKAPSGRVTRTPLGRRNILTVKGKDPNYHYRIVNDDDDNIARRIDGGYELVQDSDVVVGDKRVSQGSNIGSAKYLSVGGGKRAAVMRIKKEYHDEDLELLHKRADAQEESIKKEILNGNLNGKIELSRS